MTYCQLACMARMGLPAVSGVRCAYKLPADVACTVGLARCAHDGWPVGDVCVGLLQAAAGHHALGMTSGR